jgi:hypothetical protein
MGILDFFISRRPKTAKRRRSKGSSITVKQQIVSIKGQVDSINSVLQKHQKDIDENSALLKEHSQKLINLEDLLANPPMNLPPSQTSPIQRPDWTAKPVQSNEISSQEKRILSVFFEHQDMALSYRDVGSMLGKSANTIKNQMHQILLKADLFERLIDNDMRSRFKLKNGIKIEKYLNIDQPSNQPVGTERLG